MKRSKTPRTSAVESVGDEDGGVSCGSGEDEREVLERAPMMKRLLRRRDWMAGKMRVSGVRPADIMAPKSCSVSISGGGGIVLGAGVGVVVFEEVAASDDGGTASAPAALTATGGKMVVSGIAVEESAMSCANAGTSASAPAALTATTAILSLPSSPCPTPLFASPRLLSLSCPFPVPVPCPFLPSLSRNSSHHR